MTTRGISDAEQLKQLKKQLITADVERTSLITQVNLTQRKLTINKKHINHLETAIQSLESDNKELEVSDHAILRYCERVLNINIDDIKSKILTEKLKKQVEIIGDNGTYPVDNFRVKVKNRTIVTVMKNE